MRLVLQSVHLSLFCAIFELLKLYCYTIFETRSTNEVRMLEKALLFVLARYIRAFYVISEVNLILNVRPKRFPSLGYSGILEKET